MVSNGPSGWDGSLWHFLTLSGPFSPGAQVRAPPPFGFSTCPHEVYAASRSGADQTRFRIGRREKAHLVGNGKYWRWKSRGRGGRLKTAGHSPGIDFLVRRNFSDKNTYEVRFRDLSIYGA